VAKSDPIVKKKKKEKKRKEKKYRAFTHTTECSLESKNIFLSRERKKALLP